MAYQTLYRKYRSQTFADLVGQEATRRALQGAIASDRVSHAYLFSGTRGTGKTTTARLLAKALNCLSRAPGTSEPCNDCEACRQVQSGSALDLIEIDAASNRGIDEIRDLREKVHLAPAVGRRKVYIIDEAHMLTVDAFNALLKTLEEPPEHVVFVLCTTEANKVPATVLGRCQQFVFRRFSDEQIVGRLRHIAELEGISVDADALAVLARVAQGSMRDAIGLLDQLVPVSDGPVTAALARDLLGIADPAQLEGLVDNVLGGRPSEALADLSAIYQAGGELRQVVHGLLERCRDRMVLAIERRDSAERTRLVAVLDALLHLDGEVRRHGEPRFLVEATLVRLAAGEGTPGAAVPSASTPAVAQAPQRGPDTVPAPQIAPVPTPAGPASEAPPDEGSAEGWRTVLDSLTTKTRAYFLDARPEVAGDRLALIFKYGFHHHHATEHRSEVEPLVRSWLGESASVELRLDADTPEPAGPGAAAPALRPLAPEEDPLIKAAERKLEARVVRVRPLKETE